MSRILAILFCSSLITGCANIVVDLTANQDWKALAEYDVERGNDLRTEEQLSELGARNSKDIILYSESYHEHVAFYCEPRKGYLAGRVGKPRNDVCFSTENGWMYEQSWLSGRQSDRF